MAIGVAMPWVLHAPAFNSTYWPSPKWGVGLAGGFEKSVHNVQTNDTGHYRSLSFSPTFCVNFGKNLQWATNVLVDVYAKNTAEGIGCSIFYECFSKTSRRALEGAC